MSVVSRKYASGITFPFSTDGYGGVSLSEGDAYMAQLVRMAVSPNESDNPFQDFGTDDSAFQNIGSNAWKAEVRSRIQFQMKKLEEQNLVRLDTIKFLHTLHDPQGMTIEVTYINLESLEKKKQLTAALDLR